MDDQYLKLLEVEPKEILESTPQEEIVEYYFKLLVNTEIMKLNLKIDEKVTKSSIKEAGIETSLFAQACKYYVEEKENKKLSDGEIIEDYLSKLKNNQTEGFKGLDEEYINVLNRQSENTEASKSIEDNVKETVLDVKALKKIVKDFVEDLKPSSKNGDETDVVLEGTIQNYNKILLETRKEAYEETKNLNKS